MHTIDLTDGWYAFVDGDFGEDAEMMSPSGVETRIPMSAIRALVAEQVRRSLVAEIENKGLDDDSSQIAAVESMSDDETLRLTGVYASN